MHRRSVLVALCVLLGSATAWGEFRRPTADASRADYVRPTSIPYPDDNPFSPGKEMLGRRLFFDTILSGPKTISCSSCHLPNRSWSDGRGHAIGVANQPMALRSPTLIDVAWISRFGWDGKFRDLENVAFTPITAAANMGLSEQELVSRLSAIPAYREGFNQAFGTPEIDRRRIELALATYERSIVAVDSPFDRWIAGDEGAITASARRGFETFNGKGECAGCHSGWAFSDGSFHDVGIARGGDIGRGRYFPTSVKLQYAFKTPTLRDIAHRGPFMHDGSLSTLDAVVDHYNDGGIDRPSRSELVHPLHLSAQEKTDLVAFLKTLNSDSPRETAAASPQ